MPPSDEADSPNADKISLSALLPEFASATVRKSLESDDVTESADMPTSEAWYCKPCKNSGIACIPSFAAPSAAAPSRSSDWETCEMPT